MEKWNQYDLPQSAVTSALSSQAKHLLPSLSGSYSNGIHRVLAEPVNWASSSFSIALRDSSLDLSFTFFSHDYLLHHGARHTFLTANASMKSFQLSTFFLWVFRAWRALLYISWWISSRIYLITACILSWLIYDFSPVFLLQHLTSFFLKSFAPSSSLIGTPLSSQCANLNPGL